MKLNEVMDSPLKYKWRSKLDDMWEAKFFINKGKKDELEFTVTIVESFVYDKEVRGIKSMAKYSGEDVWDISFTNDSPSAKSDVYGISNDGEAIKVFSTAIAIIGEFLKKNKPFLIRLEAKEASRKKLYERLIRVFGTKFGYKEMPGNGKYFLMKQ